MEQINQQKAEAKLVRASNAIYVKLQKAQKMCKNYSDVEDSTINALLKKEEKEEERK